ncbi:MAG: PQQ-binding-like beta-propeller repeat protein, partial [Planctomycetota bacterium]
MLRRGSASAARRTALCVAALSLVTALPPSAAGQDLLPTPSELRVAGLEIAWWAVAPVPAGSDRIEYLSADEDAVYVQTEGNLLTAIDLTTGAEKWVSRIGREGQKGIRVSTTPAIDAGPETDAAPAKVIVCVGRVAYAIDKDSGETIWALPIPAAAAASPTFGVTDEGRRLFVSTISGSAYSYDLETIEEFNLEKRLEEFATGAQRWRYETGAPMVGPVLVDGIMAVLANERGIMVGVEAVDRNLLWRFQTGGEATAPITSADGVVYIACSDRNLYAVDVTTGLDRWDYVSREPIETTPAVVKGSLYVTPFT